MSSTKLYIATFDNGAVEETFYAKDDEHASAVAHEIAARRRLTFDMARPKGEDEVQPVVCVGGFCERD